MGKPANDNSGYQVLSFINKIRLNVLSDGRHTRTSGTLRLAMYLSIASASLQPILSCNVTDNPLSSDHCVITVNGHTKKSEPKTIITKFNINKANWQHFTSNKAWKKVTNPTRSQSAEALTEEFYKKIQNSSKSAWPVIKEKKNTSPSPGGAVGYKNLEKKEKDSTK